MIIRRNTRAFKAVAEIVATVETRPDRERLIRLYITKAGHSIRERISTEGIAGNSGLFYEMTYQSVLNNLRSPSHQLHVSEESPGIYFFRTGSNKAWDETPFEFDEAVAREFSSMDELPVLRRKEKVGKYVLPSEGKKGPVARAPAAEKVKAAPKPATPRTPDFGLRHPVSFTDLGRVLFKNPPLTKRGVLEYYDAVAAHILPSLRDRPLILRTAGGAPKARNLSSQRDLPLPREEWPDWFRKGKGGKTADALMCPDKEHLLFYVELGCVEFRPLLYRLRFHEQPDYAIVRIESPEMTLAPAVEVARMLGEVLEGLRLPSFISTDGASALHICVPLEPWDYATSAAIAQYLCRLVCLKAPDRAVFNSGGSASYGKVIVDASLNSPAGAAIAPYSLVAADDATVATPLRWHHLTADDELRSASHDEVLRQLRRGDATLGRMPAKRADPAALLKRLDDNYGFLF